MADSRSQSSHIQVEITCCVATLAYLLFERGVLYALTSFHQCVLEKSVDFCTKQIRYIKFNFDYCSVIKNGERRLFPTKRVIEIGNCLDYVIMFREKRKRSVNLYLHKRRSQKLVEG